MWGRESWRGAYGAAWLGGGIADSEYIGPSSVPLLASGYKQLTRPLSLTSSWLYDYTDSQVRCVPHSGSPDIHTRDLGGLWLPELRSEE